MPIPLTCLCGSFLEIDDKFAAQTIQCPDCRRTLVVPALQAVAVPSGPVRTSGLALASFVLAVAGAFTVAGTLLAGLLGGVAVRTIRSPRKQITRKGFAGAGVIPGGLLTRPRPVS